MKYEKSCGAVVMRKSNQDIKILLIRHNAGHWSFPKGHMEYGETMEETAIREIKEETSLDVILDTNFKKTVSYTPARDIQKDVIYFLAESPSGTAVPQIEELQDLCWYNLEDARSHITFKNDRLVMQAAYGYIKKNYM